LERAKVNDAQRRALKRQDGCAEAMLLAEASPSINRLGR
jgi:hypothetical protein